MRSEFKSQSDMCALSVNKSRKDKQNLSRTINNSLTKPYNSISVFLCEQQCRII